MIVVEGCEEGELIQEIQIVIVPVFGVESYC